MLVKEMNGSSLNTPAFHFHFSESKTKVSSARLVSMCAFMDGVLGAWTLARQC